MLGYHSDKLLDGIFPFNAFCPPAPYLLVCVDTALSGGEEARIVAQLHLDLNLSNRVERNTNQNQQRSTAEQLGVAYVYNKGENSSNRQEKGSPKGDPVEGVHEKPVP